MIFFLFSAAANNNEAAPADAAAPNANAPNNEENAPVEDVSVLLSI